MDEYKMITDMYYETFDQEPPNTTGLDTTDETYLQMLYEAIRNKKPVSPEQYDKFMNNRVVDREETNMNTNKIEKLLKDYGASEREIKNFIEDLNNMKDEIESNEEVKEEKGVNDTEKSSDFSMTDHYEALRMTEEGKDLIEKAPTMKKEELEQAVRTYLGKAGK